MRGFKCNPFALRMADIFSPQGDGKLAFQELLDLHDSLHPQAPAEGKIAWAFALWDFDGTSHSLISQTELSVALTHSKGLLYSLPYELPTRGISCRG